MPTNYSPLVEIAAGIVLVLATMFVLGVLVASVGASIDPTIGFLLSAGVVLLLFWFVGHRERGE